MNSDHLKAAMIVFELTAKNEYVTAERKLDACFAFMRYFANDKGFDRRLFYRACMFGHVADAQGVSC